MISDIIGTVIVAVIGVGVAFINYRISKLILMKSPEKYSITTVIRQVVQVLFLVGVYFVAQKSNLNAVYLLIGAVLGMTLPMIFFTKKLLSFNEELHKKDKGKEHDSDG